MKGYSKGKFRACLVALVCPWVFIVGYQSAEAQQNLAQEAYAIFQQNCLNCHGEHGAYTEEIILEHTALIETGAVVPGNPIGSELYRRLLENNPARRMPLGQPQLSAGAILTIGNWIQAGAPDWGSTSGADGAFITPKEMLETIERHINSLPPFDRAFTRYFTLTHLYNAGESGEALHAYQRALSKLVNSLSWGREVIRPQPIDPERTIFYIDLRDYEWEIGTNRWTQIEAEYPYKIEFNAPTQTSLREKLTNLREEMDCEVPFVDVDWFIATASLPPLYHDILGLPQTDRDLETRLEVNVVENIRNAAGRRVWRAGFNDSGVSNNNRVVERHTSRYGAYWKSYDFAGSVGTQNILTHPLSFTHDGGEIIFNLPNGLQAYFLVDAGGNRLDAAPIRIVRNPAASDPTVRNGLSCIGCHTEGMKTFEDQVRGIVEKNPNPPYDKARALSLYAEKAEIDALVAKDTQRYRQALEAAGDIFGGIEPVQRFYEAFQRSLDVVHTAAAVGLETDTFLQKIRENTSLQNLGLLALETGTMKRDTWTSNFSEIIFALDFPQRNVTTLVVPRTERVPGSSVYIPDATLRTLIEKTLSKIPGEPITVEDMESLGELDEGHGVVSDISNLTGLEFAVNLQFLRIKDSKISNLSPLAGLTKLSNLVLGNNMISDLSPLKGLTNLSRLHFSHNLVSDLSPLVGLTKLEELGVSDNPISDFSPIAQLTSLKSFSSWDNPIADLSPFVGLTRIDICRAGISDLSPLARATNLKELYLRNNDISDLSSLTNLTGLTRMDLEGNKISDISPLAGLTNLEWLNLEDNEISDISPLVGLTNLKWLSVTENPITDFSPLDGLSENTDILAGDVTIPDPNLRAVITEELIKRGVRQAEPNQGRTPVSVITAEEIATLTWIVAWKREIRDLTGLEFAINLEFLEIEHNLISNLSPLTGLTKLNHLKITGNLISDLSPLAGLTNLDFLWVAHNQITDLASLAGLVKLATLAMTENQITDLSPLTGLVNLKWLRTWGNPITDLSPLAGLTKLEFLDICGADLSDLSPLKGLTGLKDLSLVQNGISDISPLTGLVGLTNTYLSGNMISDVSPLANLINLKELDLRHNLISDFSPLSELSKKTPIYQLYNPGAPPVGPKIEGSWLWMIVPGKQLDNNTDLLAETSGDVVTEKQFATNGATVGKPIGDRTWEFHKISPTGWNNVNTILDSLGLGTGEGRSNHVVYGSITLDSPREQNTNMCIGSSDGVKVWLNGELIHHRFIERFWGEDYQEFFPVTLKKGTNVLLVALDNSAAWRWSGFFGFEDGTEYTLRTPIVKFILSKTEVRVEDTFTVDVSAEKVTDLAGWQFDLSFDPNVLEAVKVNEGDFLKAGGGTTFFQKGTIDKAKGKIAGLSAALISKGGVTGTGTLLSVVFSAKAGGSSQLALHNFQLGSSTGAVIPAGVRDLTIIVEAQPTWDVNADGQVSVLDLILIAQDFGNAASRNPRTDVNRDGVVSILDLILVAQHMGESTSSASPSILAMDGIEGLDPAMIQTWIEQAQVEDDGSVAFREGIAYLQSLLASLIPKETALLPNYPNPFNPETWIPYQLSEPADVTLRIYAVNGVLVRTLALGQTPAGIYQSRSRAVYWDGRNNVGESVASGIYFYTLTTGDFTATRKLLIRK